MDIESSKKLIYELSNSKIFKDYEEAFQEATQLPLKIRALGERGSSGSNNKKKQNPFCSYLKKNHSNCQICLAMQKKLTEEEFTDTTHGICFAGLHESAVPLQIGNEVIGFLQTGQVLLEDATQDKLDQVTKDLLKFGIDIHEDDRLEELYLSSKVISPKQFEAVVKLLEIFAQHLTTVLNEKIIQQNEEEPPRIKKAKRYIQDNIDHDLSLGDVASSVNWSAYYFSRMFKKATGINFVDYLSRVRIEQAKRMLLNPHLNVSEIAYEVGFQSITHFNRVFRKLTGESPSDYRRDHSRTMA
ncbi:MAG TPA: helix-turn-helix domain-containing protein [Balneolales bacterium]|nr:helix-turn-helix domain-containing protein [Balneolales bacterium]